MIESSREMDESSFSSDVIWDIHLNDSGDADHSFDVTINNIGDAINTSLFQNLQITLPPNNKTITTILPDFPKVEFQIGYGYRKSNNSYVIRLKELYEKLQPTGANLKTLALRVEFKEPASIRRVGSTSLYNFSVESHLNSQSAVVNICAPRFPKWKEVLLRVASATLTWAGIWAMERVAWKDNVMPVHESRTYRGVVQLSGSEIKPGGIIVFRRLSTGEFALGFVAGLVAEALVALIIKYFLGL